MPEPGFSVPKKSPPKSPVQTDADSAPIEKLESDIEFDDEQLPKIEFTESGCKNRIDAFVKRLYTGLPCTACGLRFLAKTQTSRYADHLDWHFRQNRKEKKGEIQKFRNWMYSASEWLAYEEIEDAEERDKHKYVENEDEENDGNPDNTNTDEKEKVQSLPVSAGDPNCAVCGERFSTFFDHDNEEWHYEDVVKDEKSGKLVHVICMGDIDNLNETVGRLERSESIASIESVEVDRPLDQVISEVAEKETEIEMKSDEPDLESEIKPDPQEVTAQNDSQEKMEVDQSEAESLPKIKEETVSNENVPMEEEQAPDLDDTTDLYGDLAELEGEEDQAMPEETPAAS